MNEFVKNADRIEFIVTMACTGRCRHCSEGEHRGFCEHIDPEVAVKAIRDICAEYKIKSLMTFGGEPLLYPETVFAIHETATELGIAERQLITNGYFTKDFVRIEEVASKIAASGVNELLLSVDAFHQETIPLEPVRYFAECLVRNGVNTEFSPAWLVSREDGNPYNVRTRELLGSFSDLPIPIGQGNIIFPSGNAIKYLGEYFDGVNDAEDPYEDDPRDIRAISFDPNGDVLGGNVYKKDILTILNEYRP